MDGEVQEPNPIAEAQTDSGPRGWYDKYGRLRGSEQPVPGKCGSRLKNTDPPRYCTQHINNCRFHRGQPKGIASPHYRGKDRSKYMPQNLRKKYREAAEDPEWTSLHEAINTLRAREAELYQQMEQLPQVPWQQLLDVTEDIRKAQDGGDEIALAQTLASLRQPTDQGAAASRALRGTWHELRNVYQEHAKLVATESRRLSDLQAKLPVEYVLMLVRAVLDTVRTVAEAKLGKDNARPLLIEVMERATKLIPAE